MTIAQMVNDGLISAQEAEVMANSRASESYKSSSHSSNEWEGEENNRNNLLSTIEGVISKVMYSPEGTFPEDVVARASAYQKAIAEGGGISEMGLSREQINGVLGDISALQQSEYGYIIQEEYSLIEEAAMPLQNEFSDELMAEYNDKLDKDSRSSEKEYNEQDNIVINESTGTAFVRQPDGSLTPYQSPGSEEGYAVAQANSDESFVSNGGEADSQAGMFQGLQDV